MAFDLTAAVDSLASQIAGVAEDEHEAAVLLRAASLMLQRKWQDTQNAAHEQASGLVLQQRAARAGKTVAELKAAAAVPLQKRVGEPVSAAEVLTVAFSTFDPPPKGP